MKATVCSLSNTPAKQQNMNICFVPWDICTGLGQDNVAARRNLLNGVPFPFIPYINVPFGHSVPTSPLHGG